MSGFASVHSSKFNISMQTPSLSISHSNIYKIFVSELCVSYGLSTETEERVAHTAYRPNTI